MAQELIEEAVALYSIDLPVKSQFRLKRTRSFRKESLLCHLHCGQHFGGGISDAVPPISGETRLKNAKSLSVISKGSEHNAQLLVMALIISSSVKNGECPIRC